MLSRPSATAALLPSVLSACSSPDGTARAALQRCTRKAITDDGAAEVGLSPKPFYASGSGELVVVRYDKASGRLKLATRKVTERCAVSRPGRSHPGRGGAA